MTYRLKDIKPTINELVSVNPEDDLTVAESKMMVNQFSQLPVVEGIRNIKGIITWKTIGHKKRLNPSEEQVKYYMDSNVLVLKEKDTLLKQIDRIMESEYAILKNDENLLTGIITLFDVSYFLKYFSEPYIELEEIEKQIREFIKTSLSEEVITKFYKETESKRRSISKLTDLTFGEYLLLLEKPEIWDQIDLGLDRAVFVKKLDEIRVIRNNVMHFRKETLHDYEMKHLKDVSRFFRELTALRKAKQ
jgi:predicted transcriptional regulator